MMLDLNYFPGRYSISSTPQGRLLAITASLLLARLIIQTLCPLLGILAKWILIGRCRPGTHSMWGPYHTRWWLVQKITSSPCTGLGVFDATDTSRVLYHRLMGASIGAGVTLHPTAPLAEQDLLTIGDGATLGQKVICRPFAVERNTTVCLAPITIGKNASIGLASIIAPGAVVPDDCCIGPNSSSCWVCWGWSWLSRRASRMPRC
ncbi:hypothetical protein B0T17DRAFT_617244 [Bombardia bombarda]|uniref:Acetyltransferase n=1 Tax=Bombardia bombarda TaxID=252184 RepID=A0AA39X181_9PEZI|nr:hypothetical protein B0T17DRAFT_617244 [Bombardia bombarda]